MSTVKKLGFYDIIQKVQIRCWDASDAGNDAPVFTAAEMLEMIEEVHRVRGLIVDVQKMTKDALPDYTEHVASPSEGDPRG